MNTVLFSGSDLDVVFSLVLTMSLSASWIAAAVLVLRLCLKRAPKWVNVLLWGIVAVRLMLPVSIESPLSLLPRTEVILPAVTAQPIQTQLSFERCTPRSRYSAIITKSTTNAANQSCQRLPVVRV